MKYAVAALLAGASAKYHLKHAEQLFKITVTEENAAAAETAGVAVQAKATEMETAEGAAEFNEKLMTDMTAFQTSSEVVKM